MKRNSCGLWFSAKRMQTAKSMLVQELGSTLSRKNEIAKRLRHSALAHDHKVKAVAEALEKTGETL
jgi:hypothetical protein